MGCSGQGWSTEVVPHVNSQAKTKSRPHSTPTCMFQGVQMAVFALVLFIITPHVPPIPTTMHFLPHALRLNVVRQALKEWSSLDWPFATRPWLRDVHGLCRVVGWSVGRGLVRWSVQMTVLGFRRPGLERT